MWIAPEEDPRVQQPVHGERNLLLAYLCGLALPAAYLAWGSSLGSGESALAFVKYDPLLHLPSFAIGKYDVAQRVAPTNPLIPLGRAHAELAAGYFGHADHDLHLAFSKHPELLEGKYDHIGETHFYMKGTIDEVVESYEKEQKG